MRTPVAGDIFPIIPNLPPYSSSVNQMLPSGPAVMPSRLFRYPETLYSMMASETGDISPIFLKKGSLNQRLPSGPLVIAISDSPRGGPSVIIVVVGDVVGEVVIIDNVVVVLVRVVGVVIGFIVIVVAGVEDVVVDIDVVTEVIADVGAAVSV